jgi:hypothetical protein
MKRATRVGPMVEQLEERTFLSVAPGLQGHEGQPGNQVG